MYNMNIKSHQVFQQYFVSKKYFFWSYLAGKIFSIWVRFVHSVPCIISWQIFVLTIKKRKEKREIDTEGWKYKYGRRPNAHPKKLISKLTLEYFYWPPSLAYCIFNLSSYLYKKPSPHVSYCLHHHPPLSPPILFYFFLLPFRSP